jgi:AcrR family transcriptional regulator
VPELDVDWMLAPLPSGRHGLPREHVVRSQRLRLLHAAIAVAGSEGYAAMTVTAVIRHAGVSRKTFYEQFADREHCFLAAYDLVAERALAGMRAAYEVDAPWHERLAAALRWALAALAAHPLEARVAFAEVLTTGTRGLERRERTLGELRSLLSPGFDAAPAGAAIPATMPQAIVGALSELIAARVRGADAASLPALLPDLLFCALAPFLGPAAAAEAAGTAAGRRRQRAGV